MWCFSPSGAVWNIFLRDYFGSDTVKTTLVPEVFLDFPPLDGSRSLISSGEKSRKTYGTVRQEGKTNYVDEDKDDDDNKRLACFPTEARLKTTKSLC